MNKKFVTLFEKFYNLHLTKDVGQIPYFMHKKFNYESIIVGHKLEQNYPHLEKETEGLKLKLLPKLKIGRISISIVFYLIFNSKKIDILNLYHHRTNTYFYIWLYKKINPQGTIYLKSDLVIDGLKEYQSFVNPKYKIRNYLLNKVIKDIDIISFETKKTFQLAKIFYKEYQDKFLYLQNGFNIDDAYKYSFPKTYDSKENLIITVGRIGTYQKNNEVLLESISKIDLLDWKVYLIGPIEKEFNTYIENYYLTYPHLKNKVLFLGNVTNKKELYEYYNKAKIFCLTSRDESFGLVYTEAISYGNFIVSTDVGAVDDVTNNLQFGTLFFNQKELANNLENLINNELKMSELYPLTIKYARNEFDWSNIINKLEEKIINVKRKN